MEEILTFEDVKDDQVIKVTKKQLIGVMAKSQVEGVTDFVKKCAEMAADNWCPAQVEMLERLFDSVLTGKPYAEPPEEE